VDTEKLIEARHSTHGDYSCVAELDQALKDVLRNHVGWDRLTPGQALAIEMIVHKIARIMCGKPDFRDHWLDVCGYVQCVLDRLPEEKP
jgi:hypothetical protein